MKLSASLPDRDVEISNAYARSAGLPSRSAVIHHAVNRLHDADLEQACTVSMRPSGSISSSERGLLQRRPRISPVAVSTSMRSAAGWAGRPGMVDRLPQIA